MLGCANQPTVDAVDVCQLHPLGKVIVVGSGPVGMRFVDELLRRQPQANIHLFGNEPFKPYNRVQLSALLSGDKKLDAIALELPCDEAHPNFVFTVAAIKCIDTTAKTVEDNLGNHHRFDHLILATGARAHVPNISGNQAQGVYTFRNMTDTQALYSRLASARHVVVAGGGVLGVEAARGLLRLNTKVTLIQQGSRLMNRQLDDEAATMLTKKLEADGVRVITDSGVREIYVDGRVTGVRIYSGEELQCDTVVLSAGIRPNIELARNSGLKTAQGIVVDDQLRTSCDSIHAIGECSEHRGKTYGLVTPGLEQAAIVAELLSGGEPVYTGSTTISRLKVIGEDVVSLGEVSELIEWSRQRTICFRQKQKNIYRKLVVYKGRLVGAVGYGDWPEFTRVQEAFQSGRTFWPWQLLWFWVSGRLWLLESAGNVKEWPANAIVCQCNQITQGQLIEAQLAGADSVNCLSQKTRAGTACGSCKPLLAELVGSVQEKVQSWQGLLLFSLLAIVAVGLMIFMPESEVALSVQVERSFEKIWNDKTWKQITGFTLLGVVTVGMLMSLRKRFDWQWMGNYGGWRLLHALLGAGGAALIVFHTGFHLGDNLNRLLMLCFLTVLVMGALAGVVTGLSHTLSPARAQSVQKSWSFFHLLAAWPLPVLLALHILSVYYF